MQSVPKYASIMRAERYGGRLSLLRIPLLAGCRPPELAMLASTAYTIAFDPGDVLCAEGAEANECYVIAEGEASVTIAGDEVARVGADDVAGERSPIADLPRAATVTAQSHMLTFAISRDRLRQVMQSNQAAADQMRKVLTSRYGGWASGGGSDEHLRL